MKIKVDYNKAEITELRDITSGSVAVEDIVFEFSDDWKNRQKTVVLMLDGEEPYQILMSDDTVLAQDIPSRFYKDENTLYIGVIGDENGTRVTTNTVAVDIVKGVPTSVVESVDIDLYSQIMRIMSATKSIAQSAKDDANSVRDDANAGKFNGADYIITEADYEAIAEKVLVDVDTDLTEQIDYAERTIEQRQKSAVSAINSSRSEALSDIESSGKTVQAKIALQGINLTTQEIPKAKNQAIGEIDESKSDALTEVNNSKEEALTQIANNKESAVSEIANKESEALAGVEQGRVGALSDISDSKDSALSAIDEKVENLSLGEQWELCQEITIDETNQASGYTFSEDSKGKDFEYDAVIIECLNMTGAGNFGLSLTRNKTYLTPSNLLVNGLLYGNFLNSVPKNVTVYVERIAGTKRWEVEAVQEDPSKAMYDNSRIVSHKKKLATNYNDEILPAESIVRAVNVYFSGSNIATSGTIKIYGRKVV